jgi:hypothetical protein
MTNEEIERPYPKFNKWWKKEKGYLTANGIWLIKLWHEFLRRHLCDDPSPGEE